jgi:DNA-binding IclR family transcriptional regulator
MAVSLADPLADLWVLEKVAMMVVLWAEKSAGPMVVARVGSRVDLRVGE